MFIFLIHIQDGYVTTHDYIYAYMSGSVVTNVK